VQGKRDVETYGSSGMTLGIEEPIIFFTCIIYHLERIVEGNITNIAANICIWKGEKSYKNPK
jgi:hypothetical protein